jgi:predicted nucleic acid-binding protein
LKAYADTSFLLSLYGRDGNSPAATSLVKDDQPALLLTPFGEAEFTNAAELRVFFKQWTAREARAVRDRFLQHLRAGVLQAADPLPNLFELVLTLARRHTSKLGTRTLDVVHVASALILGPEVFYTFDRRQAKLARAEGLHVLPA